MNNRPGLGPTCWEKVAGLPASKAFKAVAEERCKKTTSESNACTVIHTATRCHQKKLTVGMGRHTNKTSKKKLPPASSRSGATTRARSAASGQSLPITNTSPTGTASRKRGNQTANKSTAAKRSHLTKRDIPKSVKIVMDTFGESDTDSDDGVEIPTLDEAEEELVSQEQRNSRIGME